MCLIFVMILLFVLKSVRIGIFNFMSVVQVCWFGLEVGLLGFVGINIGN